MSLRAKSPLYNQARKPGAAHCLMLSSSPDARNVPETSSRRIQVGVDHGAHLTAQLLQLCSGVFDEELIVV